MTEAQEIELEIRGRSCFVAALEANESASALGPTASSEKEKILLSVVAEAHALLDASLAESGEVLGIEDRVWVDRGISIACEEWIRSPEDINTVGV